MNVAVIGAGSWGTALACVAADAGHKVMLWARKPEVAQAINDNHVNPRYLSDQTLPSAVHATTDMNECVASAEAILVVTPSAVMHQMAEQLGTVVGTDVPVAVCFKGVEQDTGLLPVQVFEQQMGNPERLAVLSGPNHAEEVIRRVPSATVIASESSDTSEFFQSLLATESFRTYTSSDVIGVEVCAAFKNVIAIAVGLSYGLGYGDNTAAMLMTRGLAEMSRLVVGLGGKALTCMGLAGTGDLIATCTSEHSRNRSFGQRLAGGTTLEEYKEQTHMVVEGALACKTLQPLARENGVELPITDLVRGIIWEGANAQQASAQLLNRPLKAEFYGL